MGVSSPNVDIDHGGSPFAVEPVSYGVPRAVPPGQCRAVLVTWKSAVCMRKGSNGGFSEVPLQVRVGWITRTELILLNQSFFVAGPSHGACSDTMTHP